MRKNFSAHISAVDLKLIDEKISEFVLENNYEPYIFMSEPTISNILKSAEINSVKVHFDTDEKTVGLYIYKGCKLYCNNDLNFGEVELR